MKKKAPKQFPISHGKAHPLGAIADSAGVNFSVYSQFATGVELLLFDAHDDLEPFQIINLDPVSNRTFAFWHVRVDGCGPGLCYAYRVYGPYSPEDGHRFDHEKVLIDVYSRANTDALWNRGAATLPGNNLHSSMRSIVTSNEYDWEGDKCLGIPMKDTVIYEMHVGGFTRSSSSDVTHPGTFCGVIEKIPYLKELGVTAVELLPVMEFDSKDVLRVLPDGTAVRNYWGYSTVGFFSPESSYGIAPERGSHLDEFRDMVKALHNDGIEVIMDVVFNHTDEGNHLGPTFSFKGFGNVSYYDLVDEQPQYYMDYTECGNTVNCNHPIASKFIQDSLEFWVNEMHVDGFRFDEGSVLTRDSDGIPLRFPPVLWDIELNQSLSGTKLIAEAWDAGGLYQIGSFPGYRWAEWNGKFRDAVRRFVKGDYGLTGAVATRIAGSSDIYDHDRHSPVNSINFVTCHDGFTLMDLVSYNFKHNEANGEENRDGNDDNMSWNCGAEGPTGSFEVQALRQRQIRNLATILLLSQGVPMILSGDEVGRSQGGNNNAYCQDNDISWFDWTLTEKHADLFRFFSRLIAFRRANASLRRGRFFDGSINKAGFRDIEWHGCKLNAPGWNDPGCRVLAFTLGSQADGEPDIHVMFNMDFEPLDFEIPPLKRGRYWGRFIDTSRAFPNDVSDAGTEPRIKGSSYRLEPHCSVILITK